jgi:uncharacterized DUF497 family protein
MRFDFDRNKSLLLRNNPKRGIGFEEAQEIFAHPYYEDCRSDDPEQFRAIGWVNGRIVFARLRNPRRCGWGVLSPGDTMEVDERGTEAL